jgi:hypothetical protein
VDGPHRRLDGEREEEGHEHQPLRRRPEVQPGQLGHEEAVGPTGTVVVERDDAHQHDQPTGEREEQELHRGILTTRSPEGPDEEVDRDEHRFEEHVEQEHVGGREDAHHERGQHEHQREVVLLALATLGHVVPRRQDADGREHQGHQDHDERDAVDPERVGHPELRDPLVLLGELELGTGAVVELQGSGDAEDQGDQ